MTEEELQAVKEMHPTGVGIWMDRMHERSTVCLTDVVLYHMPAGDLLEAVGKIETEMKEERNHDTEPG